jgi:nucleotide-binding universal stress UspA family protein
MKILIAYDGSECADAALADLSRAGFPDEMEALVLTVTDVILPPPDDEVPESELLIHIPPGIREAVKHARESVKEARSLAERAAHRIRESFPSWRVKAGASGDSPSWAVIKLADQHKADLIIVGSHGHSFIGGRLVLGSVSQRVLYESICSVRVARCWNPPREGPVRIIIGYDASPNSDLAVEAVASRSWPDSSEVRLITAGSLVTPGSIEVGSDRLRATGLSVSHFIREGNPAHVLVQEAADWGADSIFTGTRDIHGFKHFLSGSVSAAVAARALCSVEVVRKSADRNPNSELG